MLISLYKRHKNTRYHDAEHLTAEEQQEQDEEEIENDVKNGDIGLSTERPGGSYWV